MAEPKQIKAKQPEAIDILTRLDALDIPQRELAAVLKIEENKISKVRGGERKLTAGEVISAREWLSEIEAKGGYRETADLPEVDGQRAYLPVEVLPSFGGMGGGGTGEGDLETALVPRHLVEDELRAKPADLLLIEARGSSMEPDFQHGDQILIDKRDTNPAQPGVFALWDGDAYVIKLVERLPQRRGWLRIFSRDKDLSSYEVEVDQISIMGRPVWFGRRL